MFKKYNKINFSKLFFTKNVNEDHLCEFLAKKTLGFFLKSFEQVPILLNCDVKKKREHLPSLILRLQFSIGFPLQRIKRIKALRQRL